VELLADTCFLVSAKQLSPSGEYRQPVNIMAPRYRASDASLW
jgi:hypothetical protein